MNMAGVVLTRAGIKVQPLHTQPRPYTSPIPVHPGSKDDPELCVRSMHWACLISHSFRQQIALVSSFVFSIFFPSSFSKLSLIRNLKKSLHLLWTENHSKTRKMEKMDQRVIISLMLVEARRKPHLAAECPEPTASWGRRSPLGKGHSVYLQWKQAPVNAPGSVVWR